MAKQLVSIEDAREVAKRNGLDAIVIVGVCGESYQTTSYGKDRATCQAWSRVCDQIHEDIANGAIPIPDTPVVCSARSDPPIIAMDRLEDNA